MSVHGYLGLSVATLEALKAQTLAKMQTLVDPTEQAQGADVSVTFVSMESLERTLAKIQAAIDIKSGNRVSRTYGDCGRSD